MIEKIILRQAIKDILLIQLLEGKIKPDERISLPPLASELDTSVTPIREALTQLTETGIVTYKANRGFFVTNLNSKEAVELYKIIALLESDAIKNCSFNQELINELKSINEHFLKAKLTKEKIHLDTLFHQKLIENCDNQYAKKIIEDIRTRISIYELKFMNLVPTERSYKMHAKIIDYLSNGNTSSASKELNANWKITIKNISNTNSFSHKD